MESVDARIAGIAGRQGGAFTATQAELVGVNRPMLQRWLRRGAGRRVHARTYVAGPDSKSIETQRWAAVLAAGDDALVGGEAALDDWGLERVPKRKVEVVVVKRQRPLRGVKVLHTTTLHREDGTVLRGRPTTTVERTLVDVADRRSATQLCKLISEAAFRGRLNLDRMRRTMDRNRNRSGASRLQRALDMYLDGEHGTDSEHEERFARKLRAAGITDARSNVHVEAFGTQLRVDVHVERANLVIEVDPDNHDLPDKRREDALRDALLRAANVPCIRVRGDRLDEGVRAVLAHLATHTCHP